MRVLLIVDCYLPEKKSSALLIHELAQELATRRHAVTILAPAAGLRQPVHVSEESGIRLIRFRNGNVKGSWLLVRALNEISLSATAYLEARKELLEEPPDLILFYSPSIFFGPLVWYLKRLFRAPAYLVLRDIFPEWAVNAGVMRRGIAYHIFRRFEELQYAVADHIGVETTGSVEYFRGCRHAPKVEVLRNWTTCEPVPPLRDGPVRRELGLCGKTVFFYGGNIGKAQDMDNLMRLASRMSGRKDVHFVLLGAGSEAPRVAEWIRTNGMAGVTLLPAVSQERYLEVAAEFDVGVISLDRRLTSFSTTGKLLGYLRCGMPILASVNPGNELLAMLPEFGAGLCSVNGDDDSLLANVEALSTGEVRSRMRFGAQRLLAEVFSVHSTVDQVLNTVRPTVVPEACLLEPL